MPQFTDGQKKMASLVEPAETDARRAELASKLSRAGLAVKLPSEAVARAFPGVAEYSTLNLVISPAVPQSGQPFVITDRDHANILGTDVGLKFSPVRGSPGLFSMTLNDPREETGITPEIAESILNYFGPGFGGRRRRTVKRSKRKRSTRRRH